MAKRKRLKETNKSKKIQKSFDEYVEWYKKAKSGELPSVIRVTKEQLSDLGVDDGFNYNGCKLKLDTSE